MLQFLFQQHVLGGILLFLVGYIGANVRLNAMETNSLVFGKYGSKFFAALNVFQLVAWVAVLNSQGASVLAGLHLPISFPLTCVLLAVLIALWVFIGLRRFAKVTTVVMAVLTVLLVVLTVKLFGVDAGSAVTAAHTFTFWNIFEISIAMPLSWLPVISDYTKDVEKPVHATAVSAVAYSVASFWMYFIGVQIAGVGVENDIARAIAVAGLGDYHCCAFDCDHELLGSELCWRIFEGYLLPFESENSRSRCEWYQCRACNFWNYEPLHRFPVPNRLCFCADGSRTTRIFLFCE